MSLRLEVLLFCAFEPRTPLLYYSNASLSPPMVVGQQWESLVLSAHAMLYCGADASPTPNYTLTVQDCKESGSASICHHSNTLSKAFTITSFGTKLVFYWPSWMQNETTWAAHNASALGVKTSTHATITCTAMNALASSKADFNVSLFCMRESHSCNVLCNFRLVVKIRQFER